MSLALIMCGLVYFFLLFIDTELYLFKKIRGREGEMMNISPLLFIHDLLGLYFALCWNFFFTQTNVFYLSLNIFTILLKL